MDTSVLHRKDYINRQSQNNNNKKIKKKHVKLFRNWGDGFTLKTQWCIFFKYEKFLLSTPLSETGVSLPFLPSGLGGPKDSQVRSSKKLSCCGSFHPDYLFYWMKPRKLKGIILQIDRMPL